MISEGSCDTEDWSNDAENSALITETIYILKHSYRKLILNCNNNITVFIAVIICFDQINAVLVSIRDFFNNNYSKHTHI